MFPLWLGGCLLSLSGSVGGNVGTTLQKLSFRKNDLRSPPARRPYYLQKLWLFGLGLLVIGGILDFVSLSMAPQSTIAALAPIPLVSNVLFAHYWLHELVTRSDLIGSALIVAGSVISIMFGDHSSDSYSSDQLKRLYGEPGYIVFGVMMVMGAVTMYALCRWKLTPLRIQLEEACEERNQIIREALAEKEGTCASPSSTSSTASNLSVRATSTHIVQVKVEPVPVQQTKEGEPNPTAGVLRQSSSKHLLSVVLSLAPAFLSGGGEKDDSPPPITLDQLKEDSTRDLHLPLLEEQQRKESGEEGYTSSSRHSSYEQYSPLPPFLSNLSPTSIQVDTIPSPSAAPSSPLASTTSATSSFSSSSSANFDAAAAAALIPPSLHLASLQHRIARLQSDYRPWRRLHPLFYCALSGLFGAQSLLFGKSVSELLATSLSSDGSNQFLNPISYLFLLALIVCLLGQVNFFATALELYDAMYVVAVFKCCFLTLSTLGGALYFKELNDFTTTQWCMFPCGLMLNFVGIYVMSQRNMRSGFANASEEEVAAVAAATPLAKA